MFSTKAIKHKFILNSNDVIVFKGTGFLQQGEEKAACAGDGPGGLSPPEGADGRQEHFPRQARRIPRLRISTPGCFGGFIQTPGSATWADTS